MHALPGATRCTILCSASPPEKRRVSHNNKVHVVIVACQKKCKIDTRSRTFLVREAVAHDSLAHFHGRELEYIVTCLLTAFFGIFFEIFRKQSAGERCTFHSATLSRGAATHCTLIWKSVRAMSKCNAHRSRGERLRDVTPCERGALHFDMARTAAHVKVHCAQLIYMARCT